MAKRGRKKKPYGVKTQPSTQTAKANATPRMGQATKSPYHRALAQQSRKQDSFAQPSFGVGRTARTPY
jgi:hypothetical protein